MIGINLNVSKHLIFFLVMLVFSVEGHGQERPFDINVIKINTLPLSLGGYNLTYETALNSSMSALMSVNMKPKGSFFLKDKFESYYSDNDIRLGNSAIGALNITPEIRYYLNAETGMRGLYLSGFFQYSNYKLQTDMDYIGGRYKYNPSKFDVDGEIKTYTVGVTIGNQWRIGNSFYLDWQIIGPNIGFNNGYASAVNTNNRPLDWNEERQIESKFNEFNIPLIDIDVQTSSKEVIVRTKGAWALVRTGLSMGYRF